MKTRMKKTPPLVALAVACGLCLAVPVEAQDDANALAEAAQNPLAAMATLPLQANYNLGVGPYDRTRFNLNVQPVVPFTVESWNVITRTIIPVNSVPQGATDSTFGIGDTTMTLFFSPARSGKLSWGVGPILGLPTASNPQVLGSGQWGLGPSGVVFYQTGKWTMGAVASNTWYLAGGDGRDAYSLFTAQWFLNYNFGGGWAMGTAPVIVGNWKADSDQRWTVPWGLQISKVTHIAAQPINLLLGYYVNSAYPDGASDRAVRVQINFMFPTRSK